MRVNGPGEGGESEIPVSSLAGEFGPGGTVTVKRCPGARQAGDFGSIMPVMLAAKYAHSS